MQVIPKGNAAEQCTAHTGGEQIGVDNKGRQHPVFDFRSDTDNFMRWMSLLFIPYKGSIAIKLLTRRVHICMIGQWVHMVITVLAVEST